LAGGRRVACDLFVTAVGWTAPTSLLNMAGDLPGYDPDAARFRPDVERLPDSVLAAGGIVGDGAVEELAAHGDAVGREAARRAGGERPAPIPTLGVAKHPELFRASTHGIVDYSEDVSSTDLITAVGEGYRSVELAKRYTTATMGPAQGKLETVNTVAIVARATGRTIQETGATTWRPPYAPVTLGALAGPHREPLRRSPIQPWHEAHGASPLAAGEWIRPDHYGDPAGEARAVREHVGIIDVTPIGKLDLRGPDVPKLLNLVYVNKWSKLDVGKVRYGVMCAEDGVVLDDGVTGRLGDEHYLMSTTSSGAAGVEEWLELWLQTEHPAWQVHVTPMTSGYASVNVAGPKSRELMRRIVSDVDLAPEAFGYMQVRVGTVAGIAGCVLWRIGFTGELSYEVHVPAGYGPHLWQALLDHGQDLGVRPFGVEAQRILRLEKGHLIVGQDTDGLTRGHAAGLDKLIKLDKDDFIGKPELVAEAERSDCPRLVGLWPDDGSVVPDEGCQLLTSDGRSCGRVTSSRMSPSLGRAICLAQVSAEHAEPGTEISVRLADGTTAPALVTEHLAAVDPEGSRLRV
ncbi:MAG: sarcosine oxidase, partial [Micromonosporaceae bacterium]|nr:sarcosine oxidase [Micromonosporaceae bacterium]